MRIVTSFAVAALAAGWVADASAQTRVDMEHCRAITDDAQRLACYDAIDLAPAKPLSKYDAVDLADLKNFALSYRGDLVEVTGWITPGPEFLKLGTDAGDATPIPVESDALPRRDRQAFLDACGSGCRATVQGQVKPVNFTTGIVADALLIK